VCVCVCVCLWVVDVAAVVVTTPTESKSCWCELGYHAGNRDAILIVLMCPAYVGRSQVSRQDGDT
jgi:hypothetical protein